MAADLEPNTFTHSTLGRTGRRVLRIGVSASYGVAGADVERAVEEDGLSYLYWGSLRTRTFGRALRNLVARGHRERLFIVIQSYSRVASLVRPSLCWALKRLRLEQADLLLLGWWNGPVWQRVRDAAIRCREAGLCRHLGVSTHERPRVPGLAGEGSPFDVVHFRYNAAHRGAERDIFPHLPASPADRAGLVAFTATRWGKLLKRPRGAPSDVVPLDAADCYRFALGRDEVSLCVTGPRTGDELRQGLEAIRRGPLSEKELARVHTFGDLVYGRGRP